MVYFAQSLVNSVSDVDRRKNLQLQQYGIGHLPRVSPDLARNPQKEIAFDLVRLRSSRHRMRSPS